MKYREIWYLAHPVGGDVDANVQRALRWLAFVRRHEPDKCVIAPWIASILAGEQDTDPAQRERGLLDAEAVCDVVDGIVLCGGRVSSGMQRELDRTCANGAIVADLTSLGEEPPTEAAMKLALTMETIAGLGYEHVQGLLEYGCSMWESP